MGKIIDIHVHLHPPRLFKAIRLWFAENTDWDLQHATTPEEVCKVLRENNVERFAFCSYAHKPGMAEELNDWLLKTAVEIQLYGLPLATVHVEDDNNVQMLDNAMKRGAIGLKIHEDVQQFGIDDVRLRLPLDVVGAHGGFVLAHIGPIPWDNKPYYAPARVESVVASHPQVNFVIAHLGVPDTEEFLRLTLNYPNLYLDTTMALALAQKVGVTIDAQMLRTHTTKLVFGSDYPNIPYAYYTEAEKLKDMIKDEPGRNRIFYKNAEKIMGLTGS